MIWHRGKQAQGRWISMMHSYAAETRVLIGNVSSSASPATGEEPTPGNKIKKIKKKKKKKKGRMKNEQEHSLIQ